MLSYVLPKLTSRVLFLGRAVGFLVAGVVPVADRILVVVLFTVRVGMRVGTLLLEPLLETCNREKRCEPGRFCSLSARPTLQRNISSVN